MCFIFIFIIFFQSYTVIKSVCPILPAWHCALCKACLKCRTTKSAVSGIKNIATLDLLTATGFRNFNFLQNKIIAYNILNFSIKML